jgi:hypothetical protein
MDFEVKKIEEVAKGLIVGSGDIASVLRERDGAIFFAAGVSKSSELAEWPYMRERIRLEVFINMANGLHASLFYFSSIAVNFTQNRYTEHKIEMERMIKNNCNNYNIIRIGNISWGTNPNTFINYIRAKKAAGEPVEIRDEWKYMISKEQLRLVCDNLPLTGRNEISVFGECKKVRDLI